MHQSAERTTKNRICTVFHFGRFCQRGRNNILRKIRRAYPDELDLNLVNSCTNEEAKKDPRTSLSRVVTTAAD